MSRCRFKRANSTALDSLFERMACAIEPRRPNDLRRLQLRRAVVARARSESPPGTMTLRAHEGSWQQIAPGVLMRILRLDAATQNQTALIRMLPGASIEAHEHPQEEECFILEGEIFIGRYRLGAGDMHVARRGFDHDAITSPHGALMLVRSHALL